MGLGIMQAMAAFCLLTAVSMAASAETSVGKHRLIWSAGLGLKRLEGIDARLAEPFSGPVELFHKGHIGQAANCRDLMKLRAKGYRPENDREFAAERYEGARCLTLTLLKKARPARVSHVDSFQLNARALALLPPTVATSFSTIEDDSQRQAETEGKSLQQFQQGLQVRQDGEVLIVGTDTWESHIEIYARADFDGDGVEDLLVAVNEQATQGTFDSTKLLLLTRKSPEGLLHTLKRLQ